MAGLECSLARQTEAHPTQACFAKKIAQIFLSSRLPVVSSWLLAARQGFCSFSTVHRFNSHILSMNFWRFGCKTRAALSPGPMTGKRRNPSYGARRPTTKIFHSCSCGITRKTRVPKVPEHESQLTCGGLRQAEARDAEPAGNH
jgi:hypothetical protein